MGTDGWYPRGERLKGEHIGSQSSFHTYTGQHIMLILGAHGSVREQDGGAGLLDSLGVKVKGQANGKGLRKNSF